ncbi:competence damage-inducible protein A [Loigolactobacillus rennini DSM 20253]|uniref:Competence damage-inducible protein A n=2 Tax=Loigolactobacillus rennini TaxID=238013 RepID=A0A0R2D089_9LACO|nr:competence damage-inducible protein A [Loigolactobacillus rennini DSM 20253]
MTKFAMLVKNMGVDKMDFSQLAQLLAKRQLTLTSAESLTSGTFQSQLAATPQASAVYPGGFITYATTAKTKILGVPEHLIAQHGVVSPQVALKMAVRARKIVATDFALAFTGAAGPNDLDGTPVGTVCIGLAGQAIDTAKTYHFSGEPQEIMAQSCQAGLELLASYLR